MNQPAIVANSCRNQSAIRWKKLPNEDVLPEPPDGWGAGWVVGCVVGWVVGSVVGSVDGSVVGALPGTRQ
ncbi:MAG: hypothetical protein IJL00_01480, partial [Clostridia bacterium]|nr:hypothetical protein [Clostridia bacterium]